MMKSNLLFFCLPLLLNLASCGAPSQSSTLHSESAIMIDGSNNNYTSHLNRFVANTDSFNRPLVMNIGLDRQSFLNRGWSEADIGQWNSGSMAGHSGIFLSMFYALQNEHPLDPNHAWNAPVSDFDRGIGAHLDFWTNHQRGIRAAVWVYDSVNAPNIAGTIAGATRTEEPFNAGNCGGEFVVACQSGDKIFIRTDLRWALGQRMDAPVRVGGNLNLSLIIAHEFGHFLGLDHVNDINNIMNASLGSVNRIQWQTSAMDSNWEKLGNNLGR